MGISDDPVVTPETELAVKVQEGIGEYHVCPNCTVENTSSIADSDVEWVRCPIYTYNYICLGCCIDIGTVCRDQNYEDNPFKDLLTEVAHNTNLHIHQIRVICLRHQVEIIENKIAHPKTTLQWKTIRQKQLNRIMSELSILEVHEE